MGNGKEYGHNNGGNQLQIIRVQSQPQYHLQYQIINHSAHGYREQLKGEIAADPAKQYLGDDHRRQTNDDGSPPCINIRESLILSEQTAGKGNDSVAEHQSQNLVSIRIDSLGSGHMGVGTCGTD